MAAFLSLSAMAGCGYTVDVGGRAKTLGGDAEQPRALPKGDSAPRITIQNLRNTSFAPNLSLKYTGYIRREFEAGSGARVVHDAKAADYELTGQITSVTIPTLSITDVTTTENRVIATVQVTVRDLRTRLPVWKRSAMGASELFVTNDLQFNKVLQRRALEQAGEQIAGDLASRFLMFLETDPQARGGAAGMSSDSTISSVQPVAGATEGRP